MNTKQFVVNEPRLAGENIYLEGLSQQHISEKYTQWLNDKDVCRENRHGRGDNTLEKTAAYVKSVDKADTIAAFAIMTKEGNRHIGNICIENISWENNSGEISILIGEKDVWGKGVATEAYKLIIDYGFNMLGLHRLYSGMTVRNKAMIKVAEKAGMLKEGVLKDAFLKDGVYADVVRDGIINPKK